MPDSENTLGIVFVALIGIALLVQAIVMLAMFIAVRKAIKTMRADFEEFRTSVTPLLGEARGVFEKTRGMVDSAERLMARVSPKIESTLTSLEGIAQDLRKQSADVESTTQEILLNVRRQGHRVDGMLSGVLDAADRAGTLVSAAVATPARKLSGILASVKAVVGTLRSYNPHPRRPVAVEDNDTFI